MKSLTLGLFASICLLAGCTETEVDLTDVVDVDAIAEQYQLEENQGISSIKIRISFGDERNLDVQADNIEITTVIENTEIQTHGDTLTFYHFRDQHTVMLMRTRHILDTLGAPVFNTVVSVNIFDGLMTDDTIKQWMTNQYTPDSSIETALPRQVIKLTSDQTSVVSSNIIDYISDENGAQYARYVVNLLVLDVYIEGVFKLTNFETTAEAFVLTSLPESV